MIDDIADYRTPIAEDGRLDLKLVVVHVPRLRTYRSQEVDISAWGKAYWDPFQNHIHSCAEFAHQHFARETIGLERSKDDMPGAPCRESAIGDLGKVFYSYGGAIRLKDREAAGFGRGLPGLELSPIPYSYVVLTGVSFGNCHLSAFDSLIDYGALQVHVPQDCLDGFSRMWYPEESAANPPIPGIRDDQFPPSFNSSLDITKSGELPGYIKSISKKRGTYRVFVPKSSKPYASNTLDGSNQFMLVFHRSWQEMIEFFMMHK